MPEAAPVIRAVLPGLKTGWGVVDVDVDVDMIWCGGEKWSWRGVNVWIVRNEV